MKRTRLWSILLAMLCMTGALLTTRQVQAQEQELYHYEIENGEAMITGAEESVTGDVVIHSSLGGYPVTAIDGYSLYYREGLTSVVIPEGVREIGSDAFCGCPNLTSVTLPDSIQELGSGAFSDCEKLTFTVYENGKYLGNKNNPYLALEEPTADTGTVKVHKNTKVISESFRYKKNIKLSVDAGNRYYSVDSAGVLFNGDKTVLYYAPQTLSGSYTVPEGVVELDHRAFDSCKNLIEVVLPDSVTTIGDYAFDYCSELTTVTLGNQVAVVGEEIFRYCSKLTYQTYENGEYLGSKEKPYLLLLRVKDRTATQFRFHENVQVIGGAAFAGCSGLTTLVVPDSVLGIGIGAFQSCEALTTVSIGKGVISIGEAAFRYSGKLSEIIVSADNSVYSSDGHVLMNKEGTLLLQAPGGLVNYTMPDSVVVIEKEAFWNNDVLTGITIGKGVREIRYEAFGYCENLTELTVPGNVKIIGGYAFAECEKLATVTLEEGVTTVGVRAFRRCRAMSTLNLPDSLTTIGYEAFVGCNQMTSVYIPKGVSRIDVSAFGYCSALTEICVAEENSWFSSYDSVLYDKALTRLIQAPYAITQHTLPQSAKVIGRAAFFECRGIRSLLLPEGVTTIERAAFYDTGIGSMIIPASVTQIEQSAFDRSTGILRFLGDAPEVIGRDVAFYVSPWQSKANIYYPAGNATWTEEAKGRICEKANWAECTAYEITEGTDMVITPENPVAAIAVEKYSGDFVGVRLDDQWVALENYVQTGNIRIEFAPEYLATLKSGAHQVILAFDDGEALTTLTVKKNLVGDLDGKDDVAVDDAIYLLQHVLMPGQFPVVQFVDFDGSGAVGVDDAIYLLQHVLMPEQFPLHI